MFGERPFGNETSGAIPEVTIVMPCLNEADTLATCIDKAHRAFRETGIDGEVVIADNGSTDGSPDIARAHGARVVPVAARGYGNALMGGIDCRARPLRDHGRRRRQLRFPRGAEVRRRAAPRSRDGAGLPPARAAAARCCPARCRDCTDGSVTRRCRSSLAGGSARRSMTSTAACAAFGSRPIDVSACAARGWSSRPR